MLNRGEECPLRYTRNHHLRLYTSNRCNGLDTIRRKRHRAARSPYLYHGRFATIAVGRIKAECRSARAPFVHRPPRE
ncbi:hypothetical protein KGM_200683 [Danaus plexippus plexippus]|uniref:Uncharacterized protein n=1 Tax=Danaus plexippus plexippus TaxID=278856 RepID=A0A212EXD2_DANPL|nr:hypothetical protein KGM_200683 [Danaus plexippus plexippus]